MSQVVMKYKKGKTDTHKLTYCNIHIGIILLVRMGKRQSDEASGELMA